MLSVRKALTFCQRSPVSGKGKRVLKVFSSGHFANACKTKVKEIPIKSPVRYMKVDECKEEEDEYVFTVAGEAHGGKLTVNI